MIYDGGQQVLSLTYLNKRQIDEHTCTFKYMHVFLGSFPEVAKFELSL